MERKERLGDLATTVRAFLGILEKRKWFAVAVFLATFGAAVLITSRQTPVYRATASVIIDKRSPAVLTRMQEVIELGSSDYWSVKEYMHTQYEILRSRRMAKRVVDKLTLSLDEHFLGLGKGQRGKSLVEKRRIMADIDPVSRLMTKISVEPKPESQVVLVSAEDTDPFVAQQLANAVVTEYKEENLEYKRRIVTEAMTELRSMMVQLKKKKEDAEARVLEFERRHSMGSLESRKAAVSSRLSMLNERYVGARLDRINLEKSAERGELELAIGEIEVLLEMDDVSGVSHPVVVESGTISRLKFSLVEAGSMARELSARYGPKNPKMIAAYSQRRLIQRAMKEEARRLLEAELNRLQKKLAEKTNNLKKSLDVELELTRELEGAKEEEAALVKLELDYQPLVARRDEARQFFDDVKKRYSETNLSAQVETNNVRIQDLATAPRDPVRPNRKVNYALGFLIGLLLGISAAFFVESLDATLKTREDIEAIEGMHFLGLVPAVGEIEGRDEEGRDKRELFVHLYPKSSVTENFRTAKTNLFFSKPGKRPRLILVTSPGPKEGKTTVATNLAAVTAPAGSRTLIVDTDMRRPRVHKLLGISRRPGVTEYFHSNEHISRFIQRSPVEGMDVLTCGSLSPNPVEILESAKFRHMIDDLLGIYDTVIFDSPPLLAVADGKIISSFVESAVLVVRAGRTTKEALREASSLILPVLEDSIGVILNAFDIEKHSYRYYYYRSKRYGYHNYYTYGEPEAEMEALKTGQKKGPTGVTNG